MFLLIQCKNGYNKRVGSRAGQYSLFESSASNGWVVCLGVIVPIPPHTQNIIGNLISKKKKDDK